MSRAAEPDHVKIVRPDLQPKTESPEVRVTSPAARSPKLLLGCGIVASVLYVAMILIGGWQYPGYDARSQTVSELSAIGAPSRPLWAALGLVYDVLMIAFGMGIRTAAGGNRALRVVGTLLIVFGAIGFAWPPMNPRGAAFGANDAGHIAFAAVAVLIMLSTIGFGAAALGRRFRLYSIATLGVHLAFGALAWLDAPRIAQNLPTPWAGLTERVNIAVFLLWVVVLAAVLMRGAATVVPSAAGLLGIRRGGS